MDSRLIRRIEALEGDVERLKAQEAPGSGDFTPDVDQNGSVSVTVAQAKWFKNGTLVTLIVDLTVTGTGTAGDSISVGNLPFAISNAAGRVCNGSFVIFDSGTKNYAGTLDNFSTDNFIFVDGATGKFVGGATGMVLAANDTISFVAHYHTND